MKKTVLLTLILFCFSTNIYAQVEESDSLALVAIYNDTNGENWTETWDLNSPVSSWDGISLTSDGKNVTEIKLDANNLFGTLPELYLPELVKFQVAANELYGELPDFVFLEKLEWLFLHNNDFSGTVSDFSVLEELDWLYLQNNNFTFDGMEEVAVLKIDNLRFAAQQPIVINLNDEVLSVEAGGTPENNTYTWYKDGEIMDGVDSKFLEVTESGLYQCTIKNSVCSDDNRPDNQNLVLTSELLYVDVDGMTEPTDTTDIEEPIDTTETSLSDLSLLEFNISPNPNNGQFSIQINNSYCINEILDLKVIDVAGKVIFEEVLAKNNTLNYFVDINDVEAGVYFVKMSNTKATFTEKIIIR